MKKIGKALAVGFAFETVAMGIAVVLGFIHIPRVYYSQLSFPDDSLMWLRIPLALSQVVGAYAQGLYHRACHIVHTGEPDPLHLFIITFVVNAVFWSAIVFVYNQWREHRKKRDHSAV